jgi:hypothetical protein
MQRRCRPWFVLVCLCLFGCDNSSNHASSADASHVMDRPVPTDGPRTDALVGDAECHWPAALTGGACVPLRAFVKCTIQETSSSYPSTDPTSCPGCAGTCQDYCQPTEFALSCGARSTDAAAIPSDPFYGCTVGFVTPSGSVVYCCPCQ